MFDRNDVGGIEKIQLDVTGSAAVSVRDEDIFPKTSVANFSLDLLNNHPPRTSRNVPNICCVRVSDLRDGYDVLRMLRGAVKCFHLVDVNREALRNETRW